MTYDEAFHLIEKLDFPEGLRRKFAPSYSLILVNRNGDIVALRRFKSSPDELAQSDLLREHPQCMLLTALPGMYSSASALKQAVDEDLPFFDRLKNVKGFEALGGID